MARGAAALQGADHGSSNAGQDTVHPDRIFDDVGSVERRAQDGGVRDLPAVPAPNTGIVHHGDRIVAQLFPSMLQLQ